MNPDSQSISTSCSFPGGKAAEDSPPSSAEVTHYGSYTSIPQYAFMVSTGTTFNVKNMKNLAERQDK
jgi:hypothetical protein